MSEFATSPVATPEQIRTAWDTAVAALERCVEEVQESTSDHPGDCPCSACADLRPLATVLGNLYDHYRAVGEYEVSREQIERD